MNRKIENLKLSYDQAKLKKTALEKNISALEAKKAKIEEQLKANQDKLEKLNFFLEKTSKIIADQNDLGSQTVSER